MYLIGKATPARATRVEKEKEDLSRLSLLSRFFFWENVIGEPEEDSRANE
jgi:hypothetical protein